MGKPSKFAEQNQHAADRKAETAREGEHVQEPKQDKTVEKKEKTDTTEKSK